MTSEEHIRRMEAQFAKIVGKLKSLNLDSNNIDALLVMIDSYATLRSINTIESSETYKNKVVYEMLEDIVKGGSK